ncbi:unnamed protein product, partial [marine sediment metagenome]
MGLRFHFRQVVLYRRETGVDPRRDGTRLPTVIRLPKYQHRADRLG